MKLLSLIILLIFSGCASRADVKALQKDMEMSQQNFQFLNKENRIQDKKINLIYHRNCFLNVLCLGDKRKKA